MMAVRRLQIMVLASITLLVLVGSAGAAGRISNPPVFGIVTFTPTQAVRLNVVCSMNGLTNTLPPDPCHGTLVFYDAVGNMLTSEMFLLKPGESMSLVEPFPPSTNGSPMGLLPAVIPASDNLGRAIPSVEVYDMASGKTETYVPPIPRLSMIQ